MKFKIIFSIFTILTFFDLNPCFAQDACDECQNYCYAYGCNNLPNFESPCRDDLSSKACVVCANHCMFINCNQPGQVCSASGCNPCARTSFLIQTCE